MFLGGDRGGEIMYFRFFYPPLIPLLKKGDDQFRGFWMLVVYRKAQVIDILYSKGTEPAKLIIII
jgi:hypothetical protein